MKIDRHTLRAHGPLIVLVAFVLILVLAYGIPALVQDINAL
jgi:hypothetical protein